MNKQYIQHDLTGRNKKNKRALWIEILFTLVLSVLIVLISLGNLTEQAAFAVNSVRIDYDLLMQEYVRVFDTAYCRISEKIEEDPTFEELDAWLKTMDKPWQQAMGQDIYDGIGISYKGGYARSWSYGDYTDYDPTVRPWHISARAAGGETAVIAPYVTYLDSQLSGDESYILMSIVKQYKDDICVNYDIKLPEIEALMEGRRFQYNGSQLMLFDPEGYILSSTDGRLYAHNLNQPDEVLSESLSKALTSGSENPKQLRLAIINGSARYLYVAQDDNGNRIAVSVSFLSVFLRDYLAIALIVLCLIGFELFLYRRNRQSLLEYQHREERSTAITDAVFRGRLFVDLRTGEFYGNEEAAAICPDGSYEGLFHRFCERFEDKTQVKLFGEFVSLDALHRASGSMYTLENRRFPMHWKMEDGSRPLRTIEVGRLACEIDGRETVSLFCRDVSEDANNLREALKQAETASRAKGNFMSQMSHEIRTPLNAIIGYIDIAQADRNNPEKVSRCLEQSKVASRHLLSIINDVLDISSIESGRMKLSNEDFNLPQLINALTTVFYAQTKQKSIRFEVSVHDLTEEWIHGDSMRVNQILMNLLSNAVKFTPAEGEVRLDISQVGVHEDKVHLQFRISDTGIGMNKEYLNRIFQPFEQESAGISRKYGGTGLGLSICFNLVRIMGGTIQVESELGKGSVFTVMLAFDQARSDARNHLSTESFSHLRALVVDDEESTCEYVQKLLDRCGVRCDAVNSGKKALRRVQSLLTSDHPYDFCILDWNMPGMDGLDTARKIREICGDKLPIIVATAYDYSAITETAKQAGVNKIVSKPLFQSTIFDMLVNTFGRYAPAAPEKPKKQAVNFGGMQILLAEDNAMNMEIAADILSKAGMVVTPAANGREALDLFLQSPAGHFKAILMDIQMPVMDGYEATKAIRASSHPQAKSIPIIALTANAFTSDITAALAAGMNDHISKPISYDRLFLALSNLTEEPDTTTSSPD